MPDELRIGLAVSMLFGYLFLEKRYDIFQIVRGSLLQLIESLTVQPGCRYPCHIWCGRGDIFTTYCCQRIPRPLRRLHVS